MDHTLKHQNQPHAILLHFIDAIVSVIIHVDGAIVTVITVIFTANDHLTDTAP